MIIPDSAPLKAKLSQLETELARVSAAGNQAEISRTSREHAALNQLIQDIDQATGLVAAAQEARQTAANEHDPDMQALASEEIAKLEPQLATLLEDIHERLNPHDPNDDKDVIVEIRAGAGGDEAGLFAAEMFRMYARFAERQGWKTQLLSSSRTGIGGFKEVIFEVHGERVYRWLKHESGVHRVQRVPATEKSGRVHTSTVTVAVVPEVEESELVIDPKDLKIIASTSSGAGGQSVNTTYSAIRLTHLPTGITVSMQDERSQTQNRLRAMQVLRARLQAKRAEEERQRNSDLRKRQIGTGDRSEKIRTYNVPQDRVTDHRIKKTVHGVSHVLDGQLLPLLEDLRRAEQTAIERA